MVGPNPEYLKKTLPETPETPPADVVHAFTEAAPDILRRRIIGNNFTAMARWATGAAAVASSVVIPSILFGGISDNSAINLASSVLWYFGSIIGTILAGTEDVNFLNNSYGRFLRNIFRARGNAPLKALRHQCQSFNNKDHYLDDLYFQRLVEVAEHSEEQLSPEQIDSVNENSAAIIWQNIEPAVQETPFLQNHLDTVWEETNPDSFYQEVQRRLDNSDQEKQNKVRLEKK